MGAQAGGGDDGDGGLIDNNVVFFGRGAGGDSLAHQKLASGRAETQRTGHTEQRDHSSQARGRLNAGLDGTWRCPDQSLSARAVIGQAA